MLLTLNKKNRSVRKILMKKTLPFFSLYIIIVALTGCFKTAVYDDSAYNETILLKEETLQLMGKATEPYATHETEITSLLERLNQAYGYAQKRANNETSISQWKVLIEKDSNLAGGFFERWKSEGTLNQYFINEAKGVISQAYDAITELEKGKNKQ